MIEASESKKLTVNAIAQKQESIKIQSVEILNDIEEQIKTKAALGIYDLVVAFLDYGVPEKDWIDVWSMVEKVLTAYGYVVISLPYSKSEGIRGSHYKISWNE